MEILVNGDDFGKNENVTKAIAQCFGRGILSSTTLMTNMPYADEAVEIARKEGFFHKVGIHLNLTEGFPLTKEIQGSSLFCNKDGEFHGHFHRSTKYRLFMGRKEREMAALEITAQLQKYMEYELPMGHLDSHHHIHTNKPILDVLVPLLEKYKIRSMRISRNLTRDLSLSHKIYKSYYNGRLKRLPISTCDYFGGIRDFKEYGFLAGDGEKIEIMVHPMYGKGGALFDTDIPMEEVEGILNIW